MTRIPALVRSTAKSCQQYYYAPPSSFHTRRRGEQMAPAMLAIRSMSMSTAQNSPPRHDENDSATLPPKIKNTFGANFDWKDSLRIKSLLTDEEVCSSCIKNSFIF
jgi:hypothetical protein